MVAIGVSSLLLLAGTVGLANGGFPRGQGGLRYPRAARGILRPRDTTYTTSIRDPTTNARFGVSGETTTVNAGVSRWLSGLGTHNFYGNLNNYGQIIISQTDYLKRASAGGQTSDFVGHTTTDGNLFTAPGSSISLNDYGSASAPTYDWYLHTMQNYGSLQMCGRGDTGGSTYQLYCDLTCYNYGLIDMEQYNANIGASFVWRNAALSPPGASNIQYTYNYGAFRIVNVVYHNVQNVLGNGCYVIGSNAVLYLEDGSGYYQNPNFGPTFPNQTISFTDGTGDLHMDTQVYSHNSNFGPQVYGFGPGNAIEFYEIFPSSNIFTYSTATGILTVRLNSGNSVNIKLGTGYDPSLFSTGKNPSRYNTGGYNAIFYSGTRPTQTVPAVCSVSVATCGDPEQTAGFPTYVTTTIAYTGPGTIGTATTTTIPASGTQPGTVEVITPASYVTVTTNSDGVTAPYTTTIPPSGTFPGTVEVVSPASYVTITTNSDGVTAPYTTTIPPSGTSPGTVEVVSPAAYVTITTNSNGVTAPYTTTIPPSGTFPGTVEIVSPASYVTITSISDGATAASTITIPPSGTFPGTVEVITPASYVTGITSQDGVTSAYTTTIRPSGTAPGTVLAVFPAATTTAAPTSPTASRPTVTSTTIGPNQCICRPRN